MKSDVFKNLSEEDAAKLIGKLCHEDMKKSNILASVSAAQFILESGYGKTELARNANNMFGMKANLSNNTWSGSTWNGRYVYSKKTLEEYRSGVYDTVDADFRVYNSVEDSIADHSAYLLGAVRGRLPRYPNLAGEKDYKKAIQIIKDGGYATDSKYLSKICNIIERFNLTQYDVIEQSNIIYLVQVGAYNIEANAINMVRRLRDLGYDAFIKVD